MSAAKFLLRLSKIFNNKLLFVEEELGAIREFKPRLRPILANEGNPEDQIYLYSTGVSCSAEAGGVKQNAFHRIIQ